MPFAIYDSRRFSEIIEDVLFELKQDKVWKGDLKQQRRIMQSFAWITGDRELGSYDHRDVAQFKNGLKRLPTTSRSSQRGRSRTLTAIILLILGIRLAPECDDRNRAIIMRARFASFRRRLAPFLAASHQRRSPIRCFRYRASARAKEETADLSR